MIDEQLTTTPNQGNPSGSQFTGKSHISTLRRARISKISVWYGSYVNGLMVDYNNQKGAQHGTCSGSVGEIPLGPDEYIVRMEGEFGGGPLSRFKLVTNKGSQYGPFGSYQYSSLLTWSTSAFNVAEEIKHTLGLHYFIGTFNGSHIYSLQAVFTQCLRVENPVVKYEKQAPADPGTIEDVALLSEFTRNIMSPIATLLVGPSQYVFHVYERIICHLPFFMAALNGQFSEASNKRILMPEDNPSSIAALIEYLYTGHYTYPYISEEESSALDTPIVDRIEGIFHVGVFVVASKYDCQELSKAAIVSLANVLDGLKGIESVRLWKEAYCSGLNLHHVNDFPALNIKMVSMLKEVYAEHTEEMALTVKEIPELGNDFLKLLVEHAKL